jgi:ribonuclease-3
MGTAAVSQKTMATTVEAILGAVYMDGGESALAAVFVILGLTHPLLQVVTLIHSLLDLKRLLPLSTLTEFLDRT